METKILLILALSLINIVDSRNPKTIRWKKAISPDLAEERSITCIEDLGCYPENNPLGLRAGLGQDNDNAGTRAEVNTEFEWWAPGEQEAKVVTNQKFEVGGFDPSIKVKFIVHGFMARNAEWALVMKDAFMHREKCNVFIVNWNAFGSYIVDATHNTWVAGAEIGHFIVQLVETTGLKVEDIHIIGHSLGAHVAGFAGKWVKSKLEKPIGRITGLDPAGPLYHGVIPGMKLDKDDADFVDVIHTFSGDVLGEGLGLQEVVGNFDFYPNGGVTQAGCAEVGFRTLGRITAKFVLESPMTEEDLNSIACSHSRAIDLFTESIQSDSCKFMAYQCASFESYHEGKCPPEKEATVRVQMGYHADEYKKYLDADQAKSFFLNTNGESPYCKEE